jgi:hypothetical protein
MRPIILDIAARLERRLSFALSVSDHEVLVAFADATLTGAIRVDAAVERIEEDMTTPIDLLQLAKHDALIAGSAGSKTWSVRPVRSS